MGHTDLTHIWHRRLGAYPFEFRQDARLQKTRPTYRTDGYRVTLLA